LPWSLVTGAELRGRLQGFAAEGEEQARTSFELLFAVENTYKSEWGELTALSSPGFFEALQTAEDELRRRVEAEDLLPAGEGDPWEEIARAYENYRSFYYADRYLAEGATDSLLFGFARDIVRTAEERAKPEVDRLEGYSDADLPLIEDSLLADIPVDPALEELVLAFWLSKTREFLTTDDPLTKKLLGDESPEGLARRLVTGTRLADVDERRRLYEGGAEAVAASDDPMIAFARSFDAEARTLDRRWRNEVREVRIAGLERIAAARFAVHGDAVYPDATGTLRLNYGKVAGWTEPSGREVAPFTYFSGLFGRATGAEPYRLSPLWEAAREKLSPDTIFNVSTDNDIVGGNSGSPLVDRDGNVVGAAFDGNIHSLGGFYLFEPARNRTVAVAATAIEEALVKVYGLQRIVDELRR
jgi:hypothetical protein